LLGQEAGRVDTARCGHRVCLLRTVVGLQDHAMAALHDYATPITGPVAHHSDGRHSVVLGELADEDRAAVGVDDRGMAGAAAVLAWVSRRPLSSVSRRPLSSVSRSSSTADEPRGRSSAW
jgi:hypothetical protein